MIGEEEKNTMSPDVTTMKIKGWWRSGKESQYEHFLMLIFRVTDIVKSVWK